MQSPPIKQTLSTLRIAFDAKRAYQNGTGLGHYSRTLISSLATFFPQHQYYLCAPKVTNRFSILPFAYMHNITPQKFWAKTFRSAWRSKWVLNDLKKLEPHVYHGLSHEIPSGIQHTGIKTVVTIHDLIFERYPKQYNWLDVQIYRRKFKYACKNADHIIAISQQTKDDIVHFYNIPAEKITICYQSCNPAFNQKMPEDEKQQVANLYGLPPKFFLYVGSVIERKNLLNIVKAYQLLGPDFPLPLVVIGDGTTYKKQVKAYIEQQNLTSKIIWLSDSEAARSSADFQTAKHFPAIYQLSSGMVYPSVFEGFGIPVLEALCSGVPVITSNISCLPETGGDAAFYVNPYEPAEIAHALQQLLADAPLVQSMVDKGYQHSQQFTVQNCAAAVMQVYLRLL